MTRTRSRGGPLPHQLPLGVQLRYGCRLDNFDSHFDPTPLTALEGLIGGQGERCLYLLGPDSSGKSHLLQATCRARAMAGHPVAYVPLAEKAAFSPDILAGFARLDLVCVDDVERVAEDGPWERALFNLFNEMDAMGSRLVMASRCPPSVFALADLTSRLDAMLRVRLSAPDDERRARILVQRALELGFELPREAVDHLLTHQARDLHSLVAMLEGIDRFALATQRRVTLPLVRDYLRTR